MALLNYTTTIEAAKTATQIQDILARHGARAVLMNYDGQGQVVALSFQVQTPSGIIPIRLPVDPDAVLRVLERQWQKSQVPHSYVNRPQATRIAWRILKDWVEAQMAILETEMVRMEQIFLPYMTTKSGQTVYEVMVGRHFLLGEGRSE